jgi:MFS family permease
MFMTFYVYAVTLPLFVQESMMVNQEQMGLVTTVFMIASMLCRPFAGKWMDGGWQRIVVPVSGAMLAASTVCYFWVDTYPLLLMLRFVNGLAFGVLSTAIGVIVARIVPENRRGEGLGYYSLSLSLAAVFGPFIGLFVYGQGSWFWVFAIAAGFSLVAWFSAAVIAQSSESDVAEPEGQAQRSHKFRLSGLLYKGTLPIACAGLLLSFSYSAVTNFIPAYSKDGGFAAYASYFFIVLSITMVIFRPLTGRMLDRLGENYIIYPCLLLFAAGLFLLFAESSIIMFFTAGGIIGLGFGALLPAFQVLAIQSAPDKLKGTAMSTYAVFHDFGYAAGSYVLGVVAVNTNFRIMYAYDGLIVILAGFAYYSLHHRRRWGRGAGG